MTARDVMRFTFELCIDAYVAHIRFLALARNDNRFFRLKRQ